MIINFYETPSGRSPVEDFIESLQKQDQARFAEVIDGIEKHGLDYSRVQLNPLRGKLWEIKFSAQGGWLPRSLCHGDWRRNGLASCI